jgi:phosphoribosyl 1,2-cyclic phosphodiesterase
VTETGGAGSAARLVSEAGSGGDRRVVSVSVRFWGVRGSIPTTASTTRYFGGNTACVEVTGSDGRSIVLDAGTGIRALGQRLLARREHLPSDLFLTHYHWDHIQGLPFYPPLYSETSSLRIHAPSQGSVTPQRLLGRCLTPIFFPADITRLGARVDVETLRDDGWSGGSFSITSARVNHPGNTKGLRVETDEVVLAYVPDNELDPEMSPRHRASMRRLLEGADLVIHDAMFTDPEYRYRRGWGHSSYSQAVLACEHLGVRRLCFFHHSPDRTDEELASIVRQYQQELANRGSALQVFAAREGLEVSVDSVRTDRRTSPGR